MVVEEDLWESLRSFPPKDAMVELTLNDILRCVGSRVLFDGGIEVQCGEYREIWMKEMELI